MKKTNTTTTTEATTTKVTATNGWETIARKNLKNAYNWRVGETENGVLDGDVTQEEFQNWMKNDALEEIYHEAITTLYTGDSCGGEAPKEMRFAGKEFCYKYLIYLFKKDGYKPEIPEDIKQALKKTTTPKATTKKTKKTANPEAKTTNKTTKTSKSTPEVTVLLRTFTGLKIGVYTGKLNEKTQTITIHIGRVGDVEFNLDGTQKTLNPSKNPKFNNRIEIVAEA